MTAMSRATTAETAPDSSFAFHTLDGTHRLLDGYRLRYRVFCEEAALIPQDSCLSGLESDAFDIHAQHFGAYDAAGEIVGTIRLILPSTPQLPILQKATIAPDLLPFGTIDETKAAEVSRFAIARHDHPHRQDAPAAFRRFGRHAELVLGLYRCLYQASKRAGLQYWYAAMEKPLFVLLRRSHIHFHAIGPEFDYFGPVTPFCARIEDVERSVFTANPELWTFFQN